MFSWISSLFAGAALNSAIISIGLASNGGMHQMKEPEELKEMLSEEE